MLMTSHSNHCCRELLAIVAVLLPVFACPIASSQAPQFHPVAQPGHLARFEVATIKPVDERPGATHRTGAEVYPSGRVVIPTVTLKGLICTAYDLPASQLSGGEEWINKEEYDVVAKAPEDSKPYDLRHTWFRIEDPRLRQMLQELLIDRFHLKVHTETRNGPVYLLVKSGGAIRLTPTHTPSQKASPTAGFGSIGNAGDAWVMYNTTMQQLANFVGDFYLHKPVLDETGLSGSYDFKWNMLLGNAEEPDPLFGSKDELMQFIQVMGLKLKSSMGPVETIVIDHAEHPSEN